MKQNLSLQAIPQFHFQTPRLVIMCRIKTQEQDNEAEPLHASHSTIQFPDTMCLSMMLRPSHQAILTFKGVPTIQHIPILEAQNMPFDAVHKGMFETYSFV